MLTIFFFSKSQMAKPVPIWQLPSFSSIFADAMVGGTSLDGGHVVDSANCLLYSLNTIINNAELQQTTNVSIISNSKQFHPNDIAILKQTMKYITDFRELASTQIKEPTDFLPFLTDFSARIDALKIGELMIIPGGWSGATSEGSLTHILERTTEEEFSFVTCNGGCSGIEFHPSRSTSTGKLKYKTCIRINNVNTLKMKDKAFWSTLFSLWMKQPAGEYQRGEVIYDVLLPWLVGGLLPTALALTESDHRGQWRTPCRSGGSATYKSLWEAVRYIGLHLGLQSKTLKQLSYCIRRVLLDTIGRDLEVMDDEEEEFQMYKIPNDQEEERTTMELLNAALPLLSSSTTSMDSLAPLENKMVALYFSGKWCGPCQQFTPKLKEFYTSIKRQGQPFEIIFISHDKSLEEFNQYYSTMPWHALPYNQTGRVVGQKLVEKYQVSGIPTLVLLRNLNDPDSVMTLKGRDLVMQDPNGEKYPWINLEQEEKEKEEERTMSSADLHLIRFACEQTARSACKAWKKSSTSTSTSISTSGSSFISFDELSKVKTTIDSLLAIADSLPIASDVKMERSSLLPPIIHLTASDCTSIESDGFNNTSLLNGTGMDTLAGVESLQQSTAIPNTLDLPTSVDSMDQALVALIRYSTIVDELLVRAGDASTSSRLASRYQIIELIGTLFMQVLPAPLPSSAAVAFEIAKRNTEGWDKDLEEKESDTEPEIKKNKTTTSTTTTATTTTTTTTATAALSKEEEAAQQLLKKEMEAKAKEEKTALRQESALNLMAAYPQYEYDVIVGALEVSGDSISIAANLIFGKDNETARQLVTSKRMSLAQTGQTNATSSRSNLSNEFKESEPIITVEEENFSKYYETFGPNRDTASSFRDSIIHTSTNTCLWATQTTQTNQMRMLQVVHKLLAVYGSMWQAIDLPTREYDSERTCVTMCAMAIFDILIRMPAIDTPLVISELLSRDGGYAMSTAVCQNNRTLDEMSISMQLHHPNIQTARSNALDYLSCMRRSCSKTLFIFRQPQKIEIKKYSSTCTFLKRMLHKCGYPLIPRDVQRPPTEIEALCNWMFEPETPLATEHPEFGLLRDMAALSKFLLTMQTREAELIKRRMDQNRFMNFSFTFEEGGRKSSWALDTKNELRWEVVGYRGAPDKDCADVDVFFGGRNLFFGEGLVIQSPVDVSTHVGTPMPTEDDVLHADELPDFSGTLSRDESEMLFSYLVVDYARIPLILNFFSEKDRVTYLINEELQSLLLATLFESGPFVPDRERKRIERVPERMSYSQKQRESFARMQDARLPPNHRVLGTSNGLLLNELRHAPSATLIPLIAMFLSTIELMSSNVHSSDCSFVLFMTTLAIDIQSYVDTVIEEMTTKQMKTTGTTGTTTATATATTISDLNLYRRQIFNFLHGPLEQALSRWCREAEDCNDMPTACVIHSYLSLIWYNLRPSDLNENNDGHNDVANHVANDVDTMEDAENIVTSILGSLSFVRNWHGFGMGTLRSNVIGGGGGSNSQTERLMRFMQAHGIDTSHVRQETLTKFCKGGRPLYMRVGREVVRAPTFADSDIHIDQIPPADVPEARVFKMIQKHSLLLVTWLSKSIPRQLDRQLNKIMKITLKNPSFVYNGWVRDGYSFMAASLDLRFSASTSEVLWRNDELRPVPDSMIQFNDYDSMFGREPLHCGIVKRQGHRLWVHLVGKEYDLLEWDEPPVANMGIGMPKGEATNYWSCGACTSFNQPGSNGKPTMTCSVCGSARPPSNEIYYKGTLQKHNRIFDPYSEEPHACKEEEWAIELLKAVILFYFPPDKPMEYQLLLPSIQLTQEDKQLSLIGLANPDKTNATWKEFVVYKHSNTLHVYNLLSHGRKMYRSMIYSTSSSHSLASLTRLEEDDGKILPDSIRNSIGDIKEYRKPNASLEIVRTVSKGAPSSPRSSPSSPRSSAIGASDAARETLLPSRLLNGIIPSCLLENFRFWQDEKTLIISGEPVDNTTQFFNFNLTIALTEGQEGETKHADSADSADSADKGAVVTRSSIGGNALSNKQRTAISLLRSTSVDSNRSDTREDSVEVDMTKTLPLLNLGFSTGAASLGLRMSNNDVSAAACWLLDERNASLIAAADNETGGASGASFDPLAPIQLKRSVSHDFRVKSLVEDGFHKELASHALFMFKSERSCQKLAKTWLLDPRNKMECNRLLGIEDDPLTSSLRGSSVAADAIKDNEKSEKNKKNKNQNKNDINTDVEKNETNGASSSTNNNKELESYQLIDTMKVLNSNQDTALIRLLKTLMRLEDLSHLLIWCSSSNNNSNSNGASEGKSDVSTTTPLSQLSQIKQIDLPRLKMKLRPKTDSITGITRLYLLDQNGWYLSDRCASDLSFATNDILLNQLKGTSNSIFIENDRGQLQLLLANHDCCRPISPTLPFTKNLIFYRNSVTWMEVMQRRYYLYPIHTSKTFLETTSLASRLYLILLKLLKRDYIGAIKLVNVVAIDVMFTAEEQWVFGLIQTRTKDDLHPDAHAVRCKLLLAIHLFSDNEILWETHVECDHYLLKLPLISADCTLTEKEEIDLLSLAKQGTPRIKNRLRLLVARKTGKTEETGNNNEMSTTTLNNETKKNTKTKTTLMKDDEKNNGLVLIEGGTPRVGGQPWWKLGSYSGNHIENRTRSTNSFLQYKEPESKVQNVLQDEEIIKMIW